MKKVFFCCLIILFFFSGCNSNANSSKEVGKSGSVNYVQAKELMINSGAVMIDVRTKEEYDEKHINGAISLPVDEINEGSIKKIVDDKYDVIIVYCKSGSRSSKAVTIFNKLGYNNVYDLGAMSNWKE